jgi:histidinol-phosphate aminotransferase
MFSIDQLIRPHIKEMVPYSSARDDYSGAKGIFLDANENSFGSVTDESYNRYPDPYQKEVKKILSSINNTSENQIFIGNGSDEVIDLIIRLFCNPTVDFIITAPPTYGMYEVSARINEVGVSEVNLTDDFQLNTAEILNRTNSHSKILFICNPNNPSGNLFNRESVSGLISSFPGIVVLDEAYIDFSANESFIPQITNHPNLIVIQTFSKAWGMAGLRLGVAYAAESVIKYLNKIKPPYNVNQYSQKIAVYALSHRKIKDQLVQKIIEQRKWLELKLGSLSIVEKVFRSDANFLLVKFSDSSAVFKYLIKNYLIVRDRSRVVLCEKSLRITVGTPSENKRLIQLLQEFENLSD